MRLFEQQATRLLCAKIESIRNERDRWRCLHLKLAGEGARHNRTLHTHFIIKGISEHLEGHDAYVYACHDGDIFILFQGRAKPITKKLASYFADIDPEYPAGQADTLFSLYDLAKDWLFLFVMCQRKILKENRDNFGGLADPRPTTSQMFENV